MTKEPWTVFTDTTTGKELLAYTVRGTFAGEEEATRELLANENNIDLDSIEIRTEYR